MKTKAMIFCMACVLAVLIAGLCFATERVYSVSGCFSCVRSSPSAPTEELWHVESYVKRFVRENLIRSSAGDFTKVYGGDWIQVCKAFESCTMSVTNSCNGVPLVKIQVRAQECQLAKDVVRFCIRRFSDMITERNRRVLDKHTAQVRVEVEKLRRAGRPVPSEMLHKLDMMKTAVEKECYWPSDMTTEGVVVREWHFCGFVIHRTRIGLL
ncbi:MAG: hypothetical protein MJ249_09550 [Kiritimatiellae bacterium]|nr:hypothetical protein [Kiritimatiellia bacterium]